MPLLKIKRDELYPWFVIERVSKPFRPNGMQSLVDLPEAVLQKYEQIQRDHEEMMEFLAEQFDKGQLE